MAAAVLLKTPITTTTTSALSFSSSSNNNNKHSSPLMMNVCHSANMQQNQLTRSLERILEEAHLSGELKLSGRKLKDFPKAAGKYNLSDTVIADLSRNRFCELPEDVTGFPFLETLFMYHNTLRSIPDSVRGLHSLSYLDLRSNQLSVLPREICLLPLEVLLVSNNRLVSLPDELGRMDRLTELDAACNQITHLPARMSDLKRLRSLSLRNNNLVYLPREVTCLHLVSLDISGNRIATLPVELRNMTSLVNLELENNPLTSPPASLCIRGMVHVFKYLDTLAVKEEKTKAGGTFDGHTTLRRSTLPKQNSTGSSVSSILMDSQRAGTLNNRRQHVDSGYSTCDGSEKRWSQELSAVASLQQNNETKWSPVPIHIRTTTDGLNFSGASTPAALSPGQQFDEDDVKRADTPSDSEITRRNFNNGSHINSNEESPDGDYTPDSQKDEKLKSLGNVQTYREYKEALRQQRNHDSSSVYRPKEQLTPPDGNHAGIDSTSGLTSQTSTPSPTNYATPTSVQNSPSSPHPLKSAIKSVSLPNQNGHSPSKNHVSDRNGSSNGAVSPHKGDDINVNKKPIQKVTPSRNSTNSNSNATYQSPTNWTINGNHKTVEITTTVTKEYNVYVKPNSPTKAGANTLGYNNVPLVTSQNGNSAIKGSSGATSKQPRSVSWNRDIPNEKLSFTMRREFDKQKEESELIEQLRKIIESRLKMALPNDVASALTDGVVLCHLANQVKPRSVASIHVPSPAVPKLTMARCRRNVDNFLNACRNIGVDENLMCCAADVLEGKGAVQVAITVCELLRFHNRNVKSSPKVKSNGASMMGIGLQKVTNAPATPPPAPPTSAPPQSATSPS